jgi:glycosyltransferase involved in cell wall biosynthesis
MSLLVDGPADIRLMGWRSQEDTLRILAEADVLYCPYWFDPAFEEEARLSFPSKLTSYLAAGRAVLFHGPEYASPSRFLVEHDAGLCCHSLDPVAVTESLCRLFGDADLYRRLTAHGRRAFDEHLTMDCLRKSFLDFAGANDTQS